VETLGDPRNIVLDGVPIPHGTDRHVLDGGRRPPMTNGRRFDVVFAKLQLTVVLYCRQQTGTIRTNCLDCLDRTNAVQTMIGLEVNLG